MSRVIAGNWKMHLGPDGTRAYMEAFQPPTPGGGGRLLLFPPALSLSTARAVRDARPELAAVELGVQNLHPAPSGAFTGEISAEMAREAGATLALVGHSERRHLFGETDGETREKVEAALRAGLAPVLCVGETLEERRGGALEKVLDRQLDAVLSSPALREAVDEGGDVLLAYEPVWAIGTGETATPDDASEAHTFLRARLTEHLGGDGALRIPILYGGSVKPDNAGELLAAPEVDGVLVGGASLDPTSFAAIAAAP